MLLTSVANIVEQLGFDPMTDVGFAVQTTLDAADAMLQSQLNTDFEMAAYVDTFYVRRPGLLDGPHMESEFRLSNGLVTSIVSVLVASQPGVFGTPSSATDVTANVIVEKDKGVVRDFTTPYSRQYVQITYTAGFNVDPTSGSPPTSYLLSEVPDWLQNAARLMALIGVADNAAITEAQIKLDTKTMGLQLSALLARKLRYAPAALLPL